MELSVIEEDEKKLILEVKGESISFANMIKSELWNDKSVSEAAHIKEHPYLGQPKIFVKTDRGSPKVALEKASVRVLDKAKEFQEEFKRALKK
ncbi:MAG: DNA-directed RNA polymerase subunit L [Candidatus Aenigmarchaeota archaeon]|nr:DNA-directed RNA polymerase subunit L [Candidatus Aenigmarchaeota archaeon]